MNSLRVLFICTGNSCRSQIAEGFACDWVKKSPFVPIEAESAGIENHGVNPDAIAVMAEAGVDISQQESTRLTQEMLLHTDLVVTLCDHADANCPVLPKVVDKRHWSLIDPAAVSGTEQERLTAFRESRDEIRTRVTDLMIELQQKGMQHSRTYSGDDVQVAETGILYKGFFELHGVRLQHRMYKGDWTDEIYRELFVRSPAVGVLLYDPDADMVALIEQFRIGALNESQGPWQLELVAGIASESESLESVAMRECMEETGCQPYELIPIMDYLVSPGGTNEKMHLYCGLTDLGEVSGVHGLAREHEDIRISRMPVAVALFALQAGRINNAATIMALLWLQLNKTLMRSK